MSGTSNVTGVGTVLFNMAVRPNAGNQLYVSQHRRAEPGALRAAHRRRRARPRRAGPHRGEPDHGDQRHHADAAPPEPAHQLPLHAADVRAVRRRARGEPRVPDGHGLLERRPAPVYVAGFGSGKVGIFDTDALEAGTINASTKTLVDVGGGPSGLALDEARDRLYVMNRFTHDISIVEQREQPGDGRRDRGGAAALRPRAGRSCATAVRSSTTRATPRGTATPRAPAATSSATSTAWRGISAIRSARSWPNDNPFRVTP